MLVHAPSSLLAAVAITASQLDVLCALPIFEVYTKPPPVQGDTYQPPPKPTFVPLRQPGTVTSLRIPPAGCDVRLFDASFLVFESHSEQQVAVAHLGVKEFNVCSFLTLHVIPLRDNLHEPAVTALMQRLLQSMSAAVTHEPGLMDIFRSAELVF